MSGKWSRGVHTLPASGGNVRKTAVDSAGRVLFDCVVRSCDSKLFGVLLEALLDVDDPQKPALQLVRSETQRPAGHKPDLALMESALARSENCLEEMRASLRQARTGIRASEQRPRATRTYLS